MLVVWEQYLFFEDETETFGWWYQSLRLILRLFTLVSRIETDTETLNRWSQGLRPRLRPPKSQSQSPDQSLAQLWISSLSLLINCAVQLSAITNFKLLERRSKMYSNCCMEITKFCFNFKINHYIWLGIIARIQSKVSIKVINITVVTIVL